jgi:FlaA1/EpsC-like NDP-sugar epimerase
MINLPSRNEELRAFQAFSEFQAHLNTYINAFSNNQKYIILAFVDASLFLLSIGAAISLEYGLDFLPRQMWHQGSFVILDITIKIGLFWFLHIYQQVLRRNGGEFILKILQAVLATGLAIAAVDVLFIPSTIPAVVLISDGLLTLVLSVAFRMIVRLSLGTSLPTQQSNKNISGVIIYGAGGAGCFLAKALAGKNDKKLIGFVDDNPSLQGRNIYGVRVYAPAELLKLKASIGFEEILLAMTDIDGQRKQELVQKLKILGVPVKTVPSMTEYINGQMRTHKDREIDLEDLLGRKAIAARPELLQHDITDRVVLVTGGGGSIGSELCRQIAKQQPKLLLIYELHEFALYQMDMELGENYPHLKKVACLGSVTDHRSLTGILKKYQVDIIYHAAAYKHVPIVEANPVSGMVNNISGTLTAAQCAIACGVSKFVLISTDKAVRPTNIMGATKRVAELVLQGLADLPNHNTCFTMVRFGNVLGSSGSVVPRFREQIIAGKSITLTHADITRYFMTIPEAATLVIQAGAMAKGGEVFLLDMGEPVRIYDLAAQMIRLYGLEPEKDVKIEVTGLRPGEKIYEELLIDCEAALPTGHPKIFCAREAKLVWSDLEPQLTTLIDAAIDCEVEDCVAVLHQLVPEYQPMGQYAKVKSNEGLALSISDKLRKSEVYREGNKKIPAGIA